MELLQHPVIAFIQIPYNNKYHTQTQKHVKKTKSYFLDGEKVLQQALLKSYLLPGGL